MPPNHQACNRLASVGEHCLCLREPQELRNLAGQTCVDVDSKVLAGRVWERVLLA